MTTIEWILCIIGLIFVIILIAGMCGIIYYNFYKTREVYKYNTQYAKRLKSYCSQGIRYCTPDFPIAIETFQYVINILDEMAPTIDSFRSMLYQVRLNFASNLNDPDMSFQLSNVKLSFEFGRMVKLYDDPHVLGVIVEIYPNQTVLVRHKYTGSCEIYKIDKLEPIQWS
jgi:hypothetical protein